MPRSIGLILVAIFLLVLYRFLGLVAVVGLAIYGLFYYAAILLFNVTLTLPGFAGLILTIGVAADANVVVFERIKEEVRAGKSVRAAISAGYGKGFHTILDANVVTAITALVLFLIAVASVKGFALMLLIGTVISLITAVAATRGMLAPARRVQMVRQPALHGRAGAADGQVAADRLHEAPQPLVRDLGRDHRSRRHLARRARPEPRDRLQGRHADHVQDAQGVSRPTRCGRSRRRTVEKTAIVQGRGTADRTASTRSGRSGRESLTGPTQSNAVRPT